MEKKGFTLVELSIVLVIIGILIGGILAAHSMITTAQNTRIINDIQKYQIAIRLFESQYNYLPGSGYYGSPHWYRGSTVDGWLNAEGGFSMFGDMYNMGMLDKKYDSSILSTGYGVDTSPQNWPGNAIPKLSNGASIYGVSTDSITNSDLTTGLLFNSLPVTTTCTNYNFFRMGEYDSTAADYGPTSLYTKYAIDSINAQAIDTKIDDGNGSTGSVLGEGWNGSATTSCKNNAYLSTGNYNTVSGTNNCLMYFCAETDN